MTAIREFRIHRFGGPEVFQADEVEPSLPDASQVLVTVRAASVNPVDFGAQASAFKIGDEVFGMVGINGGGYAEKVVLDLKAIARKPASLDHIHAAAIPLAGQTAWQGLFRHGQLKAGQSILIHGGSGGVGHFAVQFAKAKGARVLTTVSTDNVGFARSLGADVVIDYKTQRFENHASEIDMVFDLIDGATRERSWPLLKRGGVLVSTLTDPSQDKAKQHGVRAMRYTVEADGAELAEIAELVTAGKVRPHVAKTFSLERAPDALSDVEKGQSVGKVVLTVE